MRNSLILRQLLQPPQYCIILPIWRFMLYSGVLGVFLQATVPQFHPIQSPPLWRFRVRSMGYFLQMQSMMRVADVLQQLTLPSKGQSLLGSILPGYVYLLLSMYPEGLPTGKQMMRVLLGLSRSQAYRRDVGPIFSFPCNPELMNIVRLTSSGSYKYTQKRHGIPEHTSFPVPKWVSQRVFFWPAFLENSRQYYVQLFSL